MDRRALLTGSLTAFATLALVREVRAAGAVSDGRLPAKRWIDRQAALAKALRDGSLPQRCWHDEVNRLAGEVDVAQLMAETAKGQVSSAGPTFMRDPVKRRVRFVGEDGQPRKAGYGAATFSFGAESVITPHAHRHMASAHMVISGRVRVRTFDRLADLDGALVIRPTGDHVGGVGASAAMTTDVDNIHWFTPATAQAMTFDVIIDGLDPGQPDYVIQPIDPLAGGRRPDGAIVAPILSFDESMRRYSAHV